MSPVQCSGNPWEIDWLEKHDNDFDSYPWNQDNEITKDFYEGMGITIFGIKRPAYDVSVCLACSCSDDTILFLQIDNSNLDEMIDQGFTEVVFENI